MCVVAVAWKAHPRWQLIVAGNRDELHARPAQPLARWPGASGIIAGQDVQAGGTWLGVSEQGRMVVVTNLRGFGDPRSGTASRGDMVRDLLAGEGRFANPADVLEGDFNPYNLLMVDAAGLRHLSNRPDPLDEPLAPGIYGVSNSPFAKPWPKATLLCGAVKHWAEAGNGMPEALLDVLRDETEIAAPDPATKDLPEPPFSSLFIRNPVYGTRCSTVVAVDADGNGVITERRFGEDGTRLGAARVVFVWRR